MSSKSIDLRIRLGVLVIKEIDDGPDCSIFYILGYVMMGKFYSFCGNRSSYRQESSLSVGIR